MAIISKWWEIISKWWAVGLLIVWIIWALPERIPVTLDKAFEPFCNEAIEGYSGELAKWYGSGRSGEDIYLTQEEFGHLVDMICEEKFVKHRGKMTYDSPDGKYFDMDITGTDNHNVYYVSITRGGHIYLGINSEHKQYHLYNEDNVEEVMQEIYDYVYEEGRLIE